MEGITTVTRCSSAPEGAPERSCICCKQHQLSTMGPRGVALTLLWCAESQSWKNLEEALSQRFYTTSRGVLCFLSVIQALLNNKGKSPWNSCSTLGRNVKIDPIANLWKSWGWVVLLGRQYSRCSKEQERQSIRENLDSSLPKSNSLCRGKLLPKLMKN